ncbi:MAG: hypothetical protein ACE5HI_06865 [bacterium]
MIEFQDPFEEAMLLEQKIADQIKLIRALANFHVDKEAPNADEMENQRVQLTRSLKEMETNFARLVEARNEVITDLRAHDRMGWTGRARSCTYER